MFAGGRRAKIFNGSVIPTFRAGPLNGKHKINNLCELCDSAVNKILNLNKKCLIIAALVFNPSTNQLLNQST